MKIIIKYYFFPIRANDKSVLSEKDGYVWNIFDIIIVIIVIITCID